MLEQVSEFDVTLASAMRSPARRAAAAPDTGEEEKRGARIKRKRKLPAVNRAVAERLADQAEGDDRRGRNKKKAAKSSAKVKTSPKAAAPLLLYEDVLLQQGAPKQLIRLLGNPRPDAQIAACRALCSAGG